jgi:hypothetical protein
MLFGKSKKGAMCQTCTYTSVILSVIAIVASLAALIGAYKAHVLSNGLTFGTTSGSLSLLALAINIHVVQRLCKSCGCTCTMPSKK